MKPLRALLLGLAAYAAFLAATAPATLLPALLARATDGHLALTDTGGTLWRGSARGRLELPGWNALPVDDVRWRFLPARLLAGRLAFDVEARAGGIAARVEVARGPRQWSARELRATGDAAALAGLVPLAAAWQPAGTLALEADEITWDGRRAGGAATAVWRDAALSLAPVRPLGSWRAQATAEGEKVRLAVTTLQGPLRLAGQGSLAVSGRLDFAGEARADPGRERELEALLRLLGPRRGDGAHAIALP